MKIFGLFVVFILICFALSPVAHAVVPPPDGGYPNFNTAEGTSALFRLTTGAGNTATGFGALFSNTVGGGNTANGILALNHNTFGAGNTANGTAALLNNTTGDENIALGNIAGYFLTAGSNNIDIGNAGAAAESNTIRIGTPGIHSATFVAGIRERTVTDGLPVVINANGQLGTGTAGGGGDGGVPHGMREFTASGSWPVPPGVTRILVEVWGAGGGAGPRSCCAGGGLGGAGAYSRKILTVTEGQSASIVIGHGGGSGAAGENSSVTTGTSLIVSGGGEPGEIANCDPNCIPILNPVNGAPGTPDPDADIRRASAPGPGGPPNCNSFVTYSNVPASGTVVPPGSFGGFPFSVFNGTSCDDSPGADGYVLIQW